MLFSHLQNIFQADRGSTERICEAKASFRLPPLSRVLLTFSAGCRCLHTTD